MQKVLSLFIIFILSVLPIVNASVSVASCEHMMSDSMSMSAMDMTTKEMPSNQDCCDTPTLVCDHAGACDCDYSQVNYSVVPALEIQHPQYLASIGNPTRRQSFPSYSSDSLYRPPIFTFS